MKFIKIMMACSIFVIALTVISCQKVQYKSRDTSSLKPPPPDTTKPIIDTSAVLSNCDQLDGWNIVNGGTEVTVAPKEGKGYIQGTITPGGNFMQFALALTTPVNTKQALGTGELKFWWYIQDISQIAPGGQVQMSSANNPDDFRLGWGLSTIIDTLHTGWNHVQLRFADAYGLTDADLVNLTAINYMRIFYNTTANVTTAQSYGIDDVRVDVAAPVMLSTCDQLDATWNIVNGGALETKGQKQGTGYLQGTVAVGGNFMQFQLTPAAPIDTKTTKDVGYLEFWFYVQDPTQYVTGGQIQISSANNPDDFHLGWGLDAIMPTLKPGWNHLKLKMTDAYGYTDADQINLKALNYMRVFFNITKATTAQNYGIDDVEVDVK